MTTDTSTIENCRHLVDHRELEWIPLSDGRRLAARLFVPQNAAQQPVPAILEYLPYRRRDGTRARDEQTAYWFAANGHAYARVDISGSGDSDGLIEDEYVKREQDDGLEVIDWLARQSWCSGNVGMIGISWGGFNGLQIAARRPPALKAVISLCSTVDRYHDDVHFMGGCLLNDNLDWGSIFFTYGGLPPDPEMVGEDRWRDMWLERLEGLTLYPAIWMHHQRRDAFWAHGSVIEDYAAIECPVLAVSGWSDGYSNTVFKLVEHLRAPCKGIVGPWGHKFPHQGVPGPAMGFLQECNRWWDRWLKDIDNGVDDDPAMRLFMQSWQDPEPHIDEREGHWLAIQDWPTAQVTLSTLEVADGKLVRRRDDALADTPHSDAGSAVDRSSDDASGVNRSSDDDSRVSSASVLVDNCRHIRSPNVTGMGGGEWCAYGMGKIAPELPVDQREDDAGSLVFESAPLTADLDIVGKATMRLRVAADKPQAFVAVRLNDVHPDGRVSRVSYGLLNLSHRDSHSNPQPLQPGTYYDVTVALNEACQKISAGHRIRLALSSTYWPIAWPSPQAAVLSVDCSACSIDLPVLREGVDRIPVTFPPVVTAPHLKITELRAGSETRTVNHDVESQTTVFDINRDDGRNRIDDIGTELEISKYKRYSIHRWNPLSVEARITTTFHYRRDKWDAKTHTVTQLRADKDNFYLDATITALDGGEEFFSRQFQHVIKRDCQ